MNHPTRPGWIKLADCVYMEGPVPEPEIQWNHVDGPLLHYAGRLHWLTWRERFLVWIGRANAASIARDILASTQTKGETP